ncbi:MAG: CcmD family protein [Saprospiraceae bacterium]|nr:CcmD family protein [Saprospiraceae bacterium]
MKYRISTLIFLLFYLTRPALGHGESVDFMRDTGKIYVVVAVLAVIFLVLIGYLIYLDLKTRKLEKRIRHGSN